MEKSQYEIRRPHIALLLTGDKTTKKVIFVDYQNLMTASLTDLLDSGETLNCSFFAILLNRRTSYSGYWGLSNQNLLGVILTFSGKEVSYSIKVPLKIKNVKIRKSFFPKQYIVKIKFTEGNPCKLRVPLKAYQIERQKENFEYFCKEIRAKVIQ